ncbi:MAG: C25 family cysteine peptidase [Armatimonadota bacterium]
MTHRLIIAVVLICACATQIRADSIEINLDVPDIALPQSSAETTTLNSYTPQRVERLTISGYGSYASSGNPAIPCKTIYIALPPEADEHSAKVVAGSYSTTVLDGAYDIGPVPPATVSGGEQDYGQGKLISAGRNQLVYDVDDFYPEEHLTVREVGRLRTWKIIALEFWPYSYNPVTGKLRKIQLNHATLSYSSSPYRAARVADPAAAEMSGYVSNQSQALDYYSALTGANPPAADYIIITTNVIASASAGLAHFKTFLESRGFCVRIATESDWGGGVGDVAANRIRAWLASKYVDLGTKYVLLVGNPNPSTGDVPMKMLWPRYNQVTYRETPSDYFYADLTGNWDRDEDGFYGEEPDDFGTGGIDRIPDVYVGRIPYYGSIVDLDAILEKTIRYEAGMLGQWSRKFILAMKTLDSSTPCYQLGENIARDISSPLGFDNDRIYDASYNLNPPPEIINCTADKVQQEWATGAGLVFWMTHGSVTSASYVFSSDRCVNLSNNFPSIVYGAACDNGRPEDPNNLGYSLLRSGAVSTLTASRVSWYYVGESNFTGSDSIGGLGYQYAKYLLTGEECCARAAMDSRLNVPMYIWPNQLVFNLYGDPSLVFNTTGFGGVAGRVMDQGGNPIAGALVRSADGKRSVTAQVDGSYWLSGFKSTNLDVVVSSLGYYSQRFYGLPINPGSTTPMDFHLVPTTTGAIAGFIRDSLGAPVNDAEVAIVGSGLVTHSASDGAYALDGLEPGVYTLLVTRSPYAQKSISDCLVSGGDVCNIDIALQLHMGNIIVNGSFEEGFTRSIGNQWVKYANTDYFGTPMVGYDQYKFGRYSQKIRLLQPVVESYAGFYQVASTLPGQTYSMVAWERNTFGGSEVTTSDNLVCRLGYDPMGGIDPLASSVIWEQFDPTHGNWRSIFKNVTAISPSMTIFLEAVRKLPSGGDDCYAWFDGVTLTGPVESPAVPIVHVGSRFQSDQTSIQATWSCSSPDIVDYQYAVSTTTDESGIVPGGGWVSMGTQGGATRLGLALKNGDRAHVLVRATNTLGVTSEIGASEAVRIVLDAESISVAKLLPDATWVRIVGLVTSRMGEGPECFLEEPDRRAGIQAKATWFNIPYMQPGTRADIVGCLASEANTRIIADAEFSPSMVGQFPRPLGMPNKFVGGGSYGFSEGGRLIGQAGSPWGAGANNVGLLVSVWGKVIARDPNGFTVDDGSLPGGIRVRCFNMVAPPDIGRVVRVTGIATPQGVSVYGTEDISTLR